MAEVSLFTEVTRQTFRKTRVLIPKRNCKWHCDGHITSNILQNMHRTQGWKVTNFDSAYLFFCKLLKNAQGR